MWKQKGLWSSVALVLIVASQSAGCGKKREKSPTVTSGVKSGSAAGSGSSGTGSAAVAPPPVAPPPKATATVTLPSDVAADKALSVEDLNRLLKQWPKDAEYTFVAYPAFFFGDDDTLRTSLKFAATPSTKDDKAIAACDLAESEKGKKVDNKTLVTMRGKLYGRFGAKRELMQFNQCVVVAQGAAAKPDALPLPGTEPVAVDKLVAAYMGWWGKEVTVTGAYGSITTSQDKAKKIIDVRVDLLTKIGQFTPSVGCHLPEVQPDPALLATMDRNRPALTVRGTISDLVFDAPQLEPCSIESK